MQQLHALPHAEAADVSCIATVHAQEDAGDGAQASMEADIDSEGTCERRLQQSLVLVTVEIPHVGLLDGTHAKSFTGHPHIF